MCASRLLALRERDVCSISHYGVNFLCERATRFIKPDRDMQWLFPVFQVSQGEYRWPAEHVGLDEATGLLIGAAVASAYDDILHGVGSLAHDHLPAASSTTSDKSKRWTRSPRTRRDWTWAGIGPDADPFTAPGATPSLSTGHAVRLAHGHPSLRPGAAVPIAQQLSRFLNGAAPFGRSGGAE